MQDLKPERAVESDGSWHFVGAECNRADPLDHGSPPFHFPASLLQAPDWQLAADAHRIGRELPVSQFPRGAYLPAKYLRINSRLRSLRRILRQSLLRLLGITGDRECCAPACFEGSIMPQ